MIAQRKVVLAHSSVWEYLTSEEIKASDVGIYYLDESTADKAIVRRYLNYMSLDIFSTARTLFEHLTYVDLDANIKERLLKNFATHKLPHYGNFSTLVQAFTPATRLILSIDGTKDLEVRGGVYKSTPSHVAAWQGRTKVVEELLKAGANPKETNGDGHSGLFWAVKFGYRYIEQLLREAGATLPDDIEVE
ncbi:MAG: hypothetical protein Q9217_004876 [Psora testacea]